MINLILYTILGYIIYYGANIIYDLYIRKEKTPIDQEDKNEFSLKDLAQNDVINVNIEQVEEVNIDSSFEADEETIFPNQKENERINLQVFKDKYDKEEIYQNKEKQEKQENKDIENKTNQEKTQNQENENKIEIKQFDKKQFLELIREAESKIQVVKNKEGVLIYKPFNN